MYSPTESEFQAFPPTVKRKYFSTLERLRYAQAPAQACFTHGDFSSSSHHHHHHDPRSSVCRRIIPSRAPSSSILRPHNHTSRPRHSLNLHCPPAARRCRKPLKRSDVSREDAIWFLRLPEKVRRGQFSPEEQAVLAGRLDSDAFYATDRVLYRLADNHHNHNHNHHQQIQQNRSTPSLQTSLSSRPSVAPSSDTVDWEDYDSDMDESFMESFRWLDDEVDLSLDDYHKHVSDTATTTQAKTSKTKPTYRKRSITAFPFARPSVDLYRKSSTSHSSRLPPGLESWGSGWSPNSAPAVPRLASKSQIAVSTNIAVTREPIVKTPILPLQASDPSAAHYQDPEARLKLRLYLASPQKFDEALEFGFPSLTPSSVAPTLPRPSMCRDRARFSVTTAACTFLNDEDDISLFGEQLGDETSSVPDTPVEESPATPVESTYDNTHQLPRQSTSMDAVVKKPYLWHAVTDSNMHSSNRQMTLRMTLTRPDLRGDKDILQPNANYRRKDSFQYRDPFALDDLLALEKENFAPKTHRETGMVKRLWSMMAKK